MAERKKKTLGAKGRTKLKAKAEPKPKGRPKKDVDWDKVDKFCRSSATQEEMAHWLGMSIATLYRRIKQKYNQTFQEYYRMHSSDGVMSVRRAHYKSAEDGDVRAQISILKQHGGYQDAVGAAVTELTRIFYPDNGRDPEYVELQPRKSSKPKKPKKRKKRKTAGKAD